jgi:hypothetical protein
MELHLTIELIENLMTFIDVELFAAIGAVVNHHDEVRVLPYGLPPAPFFFVRFNPLLKIEIA